MNTNLSSLDKLSKYEVIKEAYNHKIKYKPKIGLSKKIKFGIEIEALGTNFIRNIRDKSNVYFYQTDPSYKPKNIYGKNRWILYREDTLYDEDHQDIKPNFKEIDEKLEKKQIDYEEYKDLIFSSHNGGEITSPILKDDIKSWKQLKNMLEYMQKHVKDLRVNESCSAHNHFDIGIFQNDPDTLYSFIILLAETEKVLTRFYSGEYINLREPAKKWAKPIKPMIRFGLDLNISKLSYKSLIRSIYLNNPTIKAYAFDFWEIYINYYKHLSNSFENRLPNGTLSKEIIQNNIMLMGFLMQYVQEGKYDVERGIDNLKKQDDNPDLTDPLYVADMLPNDEYKLDFLTQYYKDGRTTNDKQLVKSKRIFY